MSKFKALANKLKTGEKASEMTLAEAKEKLAAAGMVISHKAGVLCVYPKGGNEDDGFFTKSLSEAVEKGLQKAGKETASPRSRLAKRGSPELRRLEEQLDDARDKDDEAAVKRIKEKIAALKHKEAESRIDSMHEKRRSGPKRAGPRRARATAAAEPSGRFSKLAKTLGVETAAKNSPDVTALQDDMKRVSDSIKKRKQEHKAAQREIQQMEKDLSTLKKKMAKAKSKAKAERVSARAGKKRK